MSKHQKAKPASVKPTTPTISIAKQRRIAEQAAAEKRNAAVGVTHWQITKDIRVLKRRAEGRHHLWAANKALKNSQPNASNTLTERTDKVGRVARDNRRGGQIKSKVADGATYSSHEVNRY